jgi:hypothetical protein
VESAHVDEDHAAAGLRVAGVRRGEVQHAGLRRRPVVSNAGAYPPRAPISQIDLSGKLGFSRLRLPLPERVFERLCVGGHGTPDDGQFIRILHHAQRFGSAAAGLRETSRWSRGNVWVLEALPAA